MIKFNKNVDFTEIVGATSDGARYMQDGYRFDGNRVVIGDGVELAKEAKKRKVKEARNVLAKAQKEFEAIEADAAAIIGEAENEVVKAEEISEKELATKLEKVSKPARTSPPPTPKDARIVMYQGRAYTELELDACTDVELRGMVTEYKGKFTNKKEAIEFLLSLPD